MPAGPVRDLRGRAPSGARPRSRRRRPRVHDHERLQAVRVRAGVRAARRRRRCASARRRRTPRGCRSTRVEAVERSADGRTNPMVNPGAIATTSLAPASWRRWRIHDGLSRFAGRELRARRGGLRVRDGDQRAQPGASRGCSRAAAGSTRPGEAVDLYTRQCSLRGERPRPRGDGRDARRRRREPGDRRARGRRPRSATTRSP